MEARQKNSSFGERKWWNTGTFKTKSTKIPSFSKQDGYI